MTDKPDVTAVYEEICRAHDGIAEFRAKLLALLPIASGAGIFLLLGQVDGPARPHLVPVGVFGALVTIGLFLYELRGIHRCNALSRCGRNLERRLLGDTTRTGTFVGEPPVVCGVVSNTWASVVVYAAVIAAWIYVALAGMIAMDERARLLLSGIALAVVLLLSRLVVWRQEAILARLQEVRRREEQAASDA